jgi:hypothetical protein
VYNVGSEPLSFATIVALLYADDMVLFSVDVDKLVIMLRMVDFWAVQFSMRINATKTKIMSVGRGAPELPAETSINGGHVGLVDSFKYLGGIVNS